MKQFISIIILVPLLMVSLFPFAARAKTPVPSLERLLYYTDTDTGYASLKAHAKQIDVLSSQAFTFDETGMLTGGVPGRAAKIIDQYKIKNMPLVENQWFDQTIAHIVLTDPSVQNILINQMVTVGKQNGYWGWQLDMEHMDASDRAVFTAFAQKLGTALHAAGLAYSIAVVSKVSDNPADYSSQSWNGWAGAFDYVPLAEASDFLSIMLYDQDDSVGPVSTLTWYNKVLSYALGLIPKDKLSIGIPFYGWEWVPGNEKKTSSHTYQYVLDQIKAKTVQSTVFNDVLGTGIMSYTIKVDGAKQKRVLWYENVKSFGLKYDILKKAGVRGFSAWAIGQEDARDWTLLPARK